MDDRYDELSQPVASNKPRAPSTTTSETETAIPQQQDPTQTFNTTPFRILLMFTSLAFWIYFDRGVYGAILSNLKGTFDLNDLEGGICSSAYLVCYCVSAPIFAQIAKYQQPLKLCSMGMLVWVAAVVWSGLAVDFVTLLLARALTGIGEASFLVMAAPLIDYVAPPAKRSSYLSFFYAAIPVGYAAGAICASQIVDQKIFEGTWRWRCVYFLEAISVLPSIVSFLSVRGPASMLAISNPADASRTRQMDSFQALKSDLLTLLSNRLFISIVLGYATQTFFVGAVAVFAIDFLKDEFDMSKSRAGLFFGAITAITGLFGSAVGGVILDKIKPKSPISLMENEVASHTLMLICSVAAAPAAMIGFVVKPLYIFLPLLFIGEFAAFMMVGPINNSIVWCVPVYLQPTGVAVCNLAIHLLGDALSPIIIGAIADSYSMRLGLFVSASMLLFPILFFSFGLVSARRALRPSRLALLVSASEAP